MTKRIYGSKSSLSSRSPTDAMVGATQIRSATIKLYDRQDGTGADFWAMTEALFRAAFDTLDALPEDARKAIALRVHEDSYTRVANSSKEHPGDNTGISPVQSALTSPKIAIRPENPT